MMLKTVPRVATLESIVIVSNLPYNVFMSNVDEVLKVGHLESFATHDAFTYEHVMQIPGPVRSSHTYYTMLRKGPIYGRLRAVDPIPQTPVDQV